MILYTWFCMMILMAMRIAIETIFFSVLSSGVSFGSVHCLYLLLVFLSMAQPVMTGGAPFMFFLLWQYHRSLQKLFTTVNINSKK